MDCAECDETHEVGRKFVVAGCEAAEVFEFVQNPLDQIAFFGLAGSAAMARNRYRSPGDTVKEMSLRMR